MDDPLLFKYENNLPIFSLNIECYVNCLPNKRQFFYLNANFSTCTSPYYPSMLYTVGSQIWCRFWILPFQLLINIFEKAQNQLILAGYRPFCFMLAVILGEGKLWYKTIYINTLFFLGCPYWDSLTSSKIVILAKTIRGRVNSFKLLKTAAILGEGKLNVGLCLL